MKRTFLRKFDELTRDSGLPGTSSQNSRESSSIGRRKGAVADSETDDEALNETAKSSRSGTAKRRGKAPSMSSDDEEEEEEEEESD